MGVIHLYNLHNTLEQALTTLLAKLLSCMFHICCVLGLGPLLNVTTFCLLCSALIKQRHKNTTQNNKYIQNKIWEQVKVCLCVSFNPLLSIGGLCTALVGWKS